MTDGTYFSELRVLLDFDSPALVLCKMPVKPVHLVDGHHVNIFLDLVDAEIVTGAVQMHSSVGKARLVLDGNAAKRPVRLRGLGCAIDLDREHLADGLDSVHEALHTGCRDAGRERSDPEFIAFLWNLSPLDEYETPAGNVDDLALLAGNEAEPFSESLDVLSASGIDTSFDPEGCAGNIERILTDSHLHRFRNDAHGLGHGNGIAAGCCQEHCSSEKRDNVFLHIHGFWL